MVAIIRCSQDEEKLLDFHQGRFADDFPQWPWITSRRNSEWENGSHLTLIVTGVYRGNPVVSRLGWLGALGKADDLNKKLPITRIYSMDDPLPVETLLNHLPSTNRRYVKNEGPQSKGTGDAIIDAVLDLRPGWADVVMTIEGLSRGYRIGTSAAAQTVSLQRDGTIGVARMAGMNIPDLGEWSPPPDPLTDNTAPPTFLSGVTGEPAHEDHLIERDMNVMLGWVSGMTRDVHWRSFNQHGQQLMMINANREDAENAFGVDAIYYNMIRQSVVLVQYKKLNAVVNGSYYPTSDHNLDKQLVKMRTVDKYVAAHRKPGEEFRLSQAPTWLKICHPPSVVPRSTDMVHGMHLAREHFEQLREDPKFKGGFSYKTVPSYLDNTMFNRLVETGLIGTAGISTELVYQLIIETFTGGKALVMGVLAGEDIYQAEKNRLRRAGKLPTTLAQ